jgi:lipopolysaccharide transport system ATP-binding protein
MGEIAIRAQGLSKSYQIDHAAKRGYRTLRESLSSLAARPFRRGSPTEHETIWALKDVSFEVQFGEALGIIGRNGAGKSTLLKILSRITQPTAGRAEVHGRLGSLLEVGTGFHPELTGRENIFLNGAILGMRRREIQARFDEIVAFAETERFLDTPVKRYSTGMYLRLAFAVAAHLETDVLIVDEVLAVGDAAFQAKCLGKMEAVSGQGRTVLFVSHNLAAVTQLCTRAILLDGGAVEASGATDTVIAQYLSRQNPEASIDLRSRDSAPRSAAVRFEWAEVRNTEGRPVQDYSLGETVGIAFGLRLGPERPRVRIALTMRTTDGLPIALMADQDSGFVLRTDREDWTIEVLLHDLRLYPGSYLVSLYVSNWANTEVLDHAEDCLRFNVVDGGRLTMRPLPRHSGLIFLTPAWTAAPSARAADAAARRGSVASQA